MRHFDFQNKKKNSTTIKNYNFIPDLSNIVELNRLNKKYIFKASIQTIDFRALKGSTQIEGNCCVF